MAKVNAPLLALNRGEVSKLALGRVDLDKLRLAADCQLNWEPRVLGPMSLRPGLEFVGEVDSDNPSTLIEFIYAKDDTALLELTANKLRVWIDDVVLTRSAVATVISDSMFNGGGSWSTADSTAGATTTIAGGVLTLWARPLGSLARAKQSISVASGDRNTEHGLRITVQNGPVTVRIGSTDGGSDVMAQAALDTGTHSLAFTPGTGVGTIYLQIESTSDQWAKYVTGCAIEAAGIVSLPTPWSADYLALIRPEQSGDIVYLAIYGHQQYKIERRGARPGARGWSVVAYRSGSGPFHAGPDIDMTLAPNDYSGNAQMSSSRPFFTADHVGALLRLFSPGQNNEQVIAAENVYTKATRVSGIGGDRVIGVHVDGTFVGTISLQRSLIGPDKGFVTVPASDTGWSSVPTLTAPFALTFYDNKSTLTSTGDAADQYNNVIAWYRLGFEGGNYTSGSVAVFFIYNGGGRYGIARISGYVSPTQVNIEILDPFSSLIATSNWQISDWCGAFGWPNSVAMHEGRIWWFSGGSIPIAGSQSDKFTLFAQEDEFGEELGDSGAILEDFGQGPSDRINWSLPLTRLLCGRDGSIASIRSSSFDQPLTPTNFSVKDCATQGAARLRALKIDKSGIFVQQAGRRVYALDFDSQAMDYSAHDLTRLNLDVGRPGFVGSSVARQRDTVIYLPRADGHCATLLFDADDDVVAWSRLQTLGIIESVCVLPSSSSVDDLVYFVVKRTVNGIVKRFIEKLAQRDNCSGGLLNQLLDCHAVYQGAASATITLAHLPRTSVQIWADGVALGAVTTDSGGVATLPNGVTAANIVAGLAGARVSYAGEPASSLTGLAAYEGLPCEVFADQQPIGHMVHLGTFTVSGGVVTLPPNRSSSAIVAFFGYMAPFMSAKLAYGAQGGTALTMKKKVDHLGLVLYDAHTQGIQLGQRFDALDDLPQVEDGDTVDADTVWGEYDVPVTEVPGEWDTDSRLCLLGQAPYPMTVGGLVVGLKTHG